MLALALALLLGAPTSPTQPGVHDALVHTYAQGKYQTDLPHAGVAPGRPVPPEAEETRTTGLRWLDYLVGLGLESVLTVLAWAVAGAVVIALLVWLARRLSLPQVKLEDDEGAPGAQPVLELAALRDAEELAAQGRFAEAIAVLSQRTFKQLLAAAGQRLLPGWTAREVLGRVQLGRASMGFLGGLVEVVESVSFAEVPVGPDEWRRCAEHFKGLEASLARGA